MGCERKSYFYNVPGVWTFVVPMNIARGHVRVTMIGGGASGGGGYQNAGGAGAPGGATGELVVDFPVRVTPGESITIEVGAGGLGGADRVSLWPTYAGGYPGGDTKFGSVIARGARMQSFGGASPVGVGGGSLGKANGNNRDVNGAEIEIGELESPNHVGGSGGARGAFPPGAVNGYNGVGSPGFAAGGALGAAGGSSGGGGGGAASPWGPGGDGGEGSPGLLSGSAHGVPEGDTGANPPSGNGHDAPTLSYGAGGGGGAGPLASYSAQMTWAGAGAGGCCLVEWLENVD